MIHHIATLAAVMLVVGAILYVLIGYGIIKLGESAMLKDPSRAPSIYQDYVSDRKRYRKTMWSFALRWPLLIRDYIHWGDGDK